MKKIGAIRRGEYGDKHLGPFFASVEEAQRALSLWAGDDDAHVVEVWVYESVEEFDKWGER